VAELIFTVSKLLNVDQSQRHHATAIAHGLNQSRRLFFNSKINQQVSGGFQLQQYDLARR